MGLTITFVAAANFFSLVEAAARHGGLWVSAGGGTARAAAGEIARRTGVSFDDALHALDVVGRDLVPGGGWYSWMAYVQPHHPFRLPIDDEGNLDVRWDVVTIAAAASRSALRAAKEV